MTRENQIAGECQDLREKYQVLLAQRDHDLSVIQQFDEEKYSNMHRELEETRRSLKEFQEHDEKLQKQLEEVIHDKDLRIQDYEQLMHRHNDLEKGYQEIQSHNQSLIRDFGNLEEQKNLHYREIVQLQEKLASLQIQNEQKDHSIHRMRKLFSQDIGSDDPLGSKDSDDVPRSPHRSLNTKEDCDRVIDSMERKVVILCFIVVILLVESSSPESSISPRYIVRRKTKMQNHIRAKENPTGEECIIGDADCRIGI